MFSTLLADADGVYDPRDHNDRLLLGFTGTMSDAELYVLRRRLRSGQLNKARRGEFFTHAPIGYVPSAETLIKDPDDQVRSVVELVFAKFQELQSASGVLRYLCDHQIQIGCRAHRGPDKGQLRWRAATQSTIIGILHHPVYARAYAYGRRENNPAKMVPAQPGKGRRWGKPEDWDVLIRDRLPAYIKWEQWEQNQKQLKVKQHSFRSAWYRTRRQVLIAISPASLALRVEATRQLEADQTTVERNHKQTIERTTYDPCINLAKVAITRLVELDPQRRTLDRVGR